ncbi:methyltransferase domain-containing protein [Allohahella sp. A8]|uniref:methyltransferase domain-containing protein n=1 Tax=Allohahella sp. A8 TaxID=3141461 RepID=UPI003A7FBFA4
MPEPTLIYLLQTPITDARALRAEVEFISPLPLDFRIIEDLQTLKQLLLRSQDAVSEGSQKPPALLLYWQITRRRLREGCDLLLRACFKDNDEHRALESLRNVLPWQDDAVIAARFEDLLLAFQQRQLDQNDLVQRLTKLAVDLDHLYRQVVAGAAPACLDLIRIPEAADPAHAAALIVERLALQHGQSFEPLQQHFSQRIYASDKGRIRLDLILEDVLAIAEQAQKPMQVLDVGCGEAPVSRRLLGTTQRLVLIEPSPSMLDTAVANVESALVSLGNAAPTVEAFKGYAQSSIASIKGEFDLILAHAVIEWTEAPLALLGQLCDRLGPRGRLSLAVYNEHGLRFRRLIRGQYDDLPPRPRNYKGGLTPIHPLAPEEIETWCRARGLRIERLRGLRCFADYQASPRDSVRPGASPSDNATAGPPKGSKAFASALDQYQQLLSAEREVSRQDPFRRLARYLHIVICRDQD